MNKHELIEAIAQKRHINKAVLELAYDEIFTEIVKAVASGQVVEIPSFGVFHCSEQHLGRTRVPSKKIIPDFSPDLRFRDAVRNGGTGDKQ
jgi:nucleoid DNA-binding protein